jgi:transposase
VAIAVAEEFSEMPERRCLTRVCSGGEVVIYWGPRVFCAYDEDDLGLRNLAIVGLTKAGFSCNDVAVCFSLTPQYISMLRSRARDRGSAGLVRPRGRHRSLSPQALLRAAAWRRAGMSDVAIGERLGVHSGTIGRRLAAMKNETSRSEPGADDTLFADDAEPSGNIEPDSDDGMGGEETPVDEADAPGKFDDDALTDGPETTDDTTVVATAIPRLIDTEVPSRYAGAMLLHPFLTRLGADEILSSLPKAAARRYDASSLVLASAFSFALGTSSMEGTKHLVTGDAGALLGASAFPHLRTLRPGIKALAEASDPVAIQTAFAKAMLSADEHPPEVFYVDDHFVTYWGKAPVAKGYNIRRHLAEPGRDDTFVVDQSWRAICFATGEARGLSVSLPEILGQLNEVVGDRPVMIGFDRGGSYPKVFNALAEADMEWITWRRAPLVVPTATPKRSWVKVDGERRTSLLSDELVELSAYDHGPVRQLSAYENDKVAFQVLTSNQQLNGAKLVHKLRGRWCIENFNKYAEDHQGIHWLCTYDMDTEANTAKVTNPARRSARAKINEAEVVLAEAERALGRQVDNRVVGMDEHLAEMRTRRDDVSMANDELVETRQGLKGIPAKLPANELDPNAKRAKPRVAARALQMVCRLLAYNAELDLARHLNTYLDDNDEYRSITRNLLHLGGRIAFERRRITVTLDRPNAPRVTRALSQLLAELADGPPAHLAGDRRPIVYRLAE